METVARLSDWLTAALLVPEVRLKLVPLGLRRRGDQPIGGIDDHRSALTGPLVRLEQAIMCARNIELRSCQTVVSDCDVVLASGLSVNAERSYHRSAGRSCERAAAVLRFRRYVEHAIADGSRETRRSPSVAGSSKADGQGASKVDAGG
jgi:hypothetical protein